MFSICRGFYRTFIPERQRLCKRGTIELVPFAFSPKPERNYPRALKQKSVETVSFVSDPLDALGKIMSPP